MSCVLFSEHGDWTEVGTEWKHLAATLHSCGVLSTDLGSYDRSLGMPTLSDIRDQLDRDVRRSTVRVHGRIVHAAEPVLQHTQFPRLCTEQAFRPIIEGLLEHGTVVFCVPGQKQHVWIGHQGSVEVQLPVCVLDSERSPSTRGLLKLEARHTTVELRLERMLVSHVPEEAVSTTTRSQAPKAGAAQAAESSQDPGAAMAAFSRLAAPVQAESRKRDVWANGGVTLL